MSTRNLKAKVDVGTFEDLTGELVKLAPGDRVLGRYVGSSTVAGDQGPYEVYAFVDDVGCYKIPGVVQLTTAMKTVEVGDIVYIERQADGKSGKGRTYQNYIVKVNRVE